MGEGMRPDTVGGSASAQRSTRLLPLVYQDLRALAARLMAQEKPGHTLQATALVHEAWLRLEAPSGFKWKDRNHFFATAAEVMRRILIERARRRKALRHGGEAQRVELDAIEIAVPMADDKLLALDEALDRLANIDPVAAKLIKLRFFVGLKHTEAAKVLGLNRTAADRAWVFARAWLYKEVAESMF